MKKILILLAVCATVWCCSKDDEEARFSPEGKKLVAKIRCEDIENETEYDQMVFQYDKNGNIEKVTENDPEDEDTYTVVFKHSNDKITIDYTEVYVEDGKTETDKGTTVYMLNDKGYVASCEMVWGDNERGKDTYSYNTEGQLVKYVSEETYGSSFRKETYEYGWANGNLVSRKQTGSSYTNTYAYTDEENKANIDLGALYWNIGTNDWLELFGYLGKINKNFLAKYGSTTYKYTFDDEGYATQIQEYENNTLRYRYTIEYK